MGNEYRNHLKAMIPSLALYFCVLVMGFVVWNIIFMWGVNPYHHEYEYVKDVEYSNVIESSKEYDGYIRIKKLDNLITFTNNQGKRMNEIVYISDEFGLYSDLNLNEHEIAVSEKMAQKLDLFIGATVLAEFPIYDQPVEFTVVKILPYAADLYDTLDNQDFSYAFVGDDGVLKHQASGFMVYFLNANQYKEYLSMEYSYFGKYDMVEEREAIAFQNGIRHAVMACLLLVMVLIVAVLMHREINKEIVKYYYDGYDISVVKNFDRKDHLVFMGFPVLIQIVYMLIFKKVMGYADWYLVGIIVMLVLVTMIAVFVGGRKYGKAA